MDNKDQDPLFDSSVVQIEILPGLAVVIASSVLDIKDEHSDGTILVSFPDNESLDPLLVKFKLISKHLDVQLGLYDEHRLARYISIVVRNTVKHYISIPIKFNTLTFTHKAFSNVNHIVTWSGAL